MKLLLILCICLTAALLANAQVITFNPEKIVMGNVVKIKLNINEPEVANNYQVMTDIGGDKALSFSSDTLLTLGSPLQPSVCHLAVQFDTLTRFYQVFVANKVPAKNVFERPAFTYPSAANALTTKLNQLADYVANDSLTVPAASWMLSLQVYALNNDSCLLTFGQYEFSGNAAALKKYLAATVAKVYAGDVMLSKLLTEIISAPPLIGANKKIDAPATDAFTPKKVWQGLDLYTASGSRSLTLYFKIRP